MPALGKDDAMRAFVINEYGDPDVLQMVNDAPEPVVGPDSILIRTKAVSVNPVDWKVVAGYLQGAFPSHLPLIPCWDVAGVVEKVGPAIVDFAPGDEVLAYNRQDHLQLGTLSEFVSAPFRCVGHKPADLSFAEAAALPLVGLTAEQSVIAAEIRKDDTVLVLNASGGVGSMAVQLAARRGARVLGTCSPSNFGYVRSLGAEPVQYGDSLVADVRAHAPGGVDVVLDFIGDGLREAASLATDDGRLISIVDAQTVHELGGRYVFVHPDSGMLTELAALAAAKQLEIEIAESFPFARAAEALKRNQEGHVRGKVVIEF
jgi:NADPH:quinone reductase-like Zn-dependent oxidoreductase